MKKKKKMKSSWVNHCYMAIYHLRKMASMLGTPERFDHHLKYAAKHLDAIKKS
jgi:rhamnogalacturonyl hydrolase YesR